uniref:Uncharacterized protein n=1 Tax=Palpitomonas bilix TaxID=652834 RepID=A0A7S3G2D1_9EUKA
MKEDRSKPQSSGYESMPPVVGRSMMEEREGGERKENEDKDGDKWRGIDESSEEVESIPVDEEVDELEAETEEDSKSSTPFSPMWRSGRVQEEEEEVEEDRKGEGSGKGGEREGEKESDDDLFPFFDEEHDMDIPYLPSYSSLSLRGSAEEKEDEKRGREEGMDTGQLHACQVSFHRQRAAVEKLARKVVEKGVKPLVVKTTPGRLKKSEHEQLLVRLCESLVSTGNIERAVKAAMQENRSGIQFEVFRLA